MRLLFLLLTAVCGLFGWWLPQNVAVPSEAQTAPVDVCSEDPYYAQATAALDWYAAHPDDAPNYAQGYSHAVLDGAYLSLLEQGLIDPVPSPCTVTAQVTASIYDGVDGTVIGELAAGAEVTLYGRNDAYTWWNVLDEGVGWGWVRAGDVALQPGTDQDRIPLR
jgi:hypothetical protein